MDCKFSEQSFPMSTDASNVEDINIPHIKECLLLSCVAFFEDWFCIFRTRSFTLCKNDLDFKDLSDSAMVLESISSSSMINLSVCSANKPGCCSLTGLSVVTSINSSDSILSNLMSKRLKQVSPFLVAAQSTSSEVFDFHICFSPGSLMQ